MSQWSGQHLEHNAQRQKPLRALLLTPLPPSKEKKFLAVINVLPPQLHSRRTNTNMVVTRILDYGPGPPIPASPARQKANPKRSSYIHAWLGDFESEGISGKADDITTKLASIGYDSLASLIEMRSEEAPAQLEKLDILAIHAQMIIRDARAIHYQVITRHSLLSPDHLLRSLLTRKRNLGRPGLSE